MNVEIGAEAAQFPEKEYINGIAVAVQTNRAGTKKDTILTINCVNNKRKIEAKE
jgi:hypothetical protein